MGEKTQTVPILEMRAIRKEFPGVLALDGVDLRLYPGEVHALVGENGAGKSTLMKILGGVYQPDGGEIELGGKRVEALNPRYAYELGIALVHQELLLCPNLTVAENIYLSQMGTRFPLASIGWRDLMAQARRIIEDYELDIDPDLPVEELSIGQQQMVEIVKALSHDVRILILDEPTSSLSDEDAQFLFDVIERLKATGVAIVFIGHRLKEIFRLADRATVLRDGSKVADLDDLRQVSQDQLINLMVGRPPVSHTRRTGTEKAEPILEVRRLTHTGVYQDISFQLYPGEILGVAGLIGAGRTEMVRGIIGADARTGGEVHLDGQRVELSSPADALRHGIVLVPEDRKNQGLILEMSVAENAGLAAMKRLARPFGLLDHRSLREKVSGLVRALRVRTPHLEQPVEYLSGGNQQKVVLAKWLAVGPRVLILDEPTRGIDVGAKDEIYQLMDELTQEGRSILMVSSELPEILRMSDRILVMSEGRVAGILDGRGATEEAVLQLAHRFDSAAHKVS